jgi:hypothetical protein
VDDLRTLARRVVAARGGARRWDGYDRFKVILADYQIRLIDDTRPLISRHWGRRTGKTTAFIGKTLRVFGEHVNAKVFYFAPTGEQGVDIIWEELQQYNRQFELGLKEHWSEKWWTLEGRKLEVFSFHDRSDVARARGRKAHLVDVDEAQLAPDWFAHECESAIMPVTLDYLGQVWATGTPAPAAEGFFFDACHESKWACEEPITAASNPFFLRQGRDPLREARERFNLTLESITYRREWLGLWIVDPDALVYAIPEAAVIMAPATYYAHVYGLDFGFRDKDALGRVDVSGERNRAHLGWLEEWDGHQTNHELFARILREQERFPGPVVFDPAGHTTKKTIETFRNDAPKIQWVMAEKARKVEFIQTLNDDMRSGAATVEPGSPMLREARRLRWKRPGKLATDADHSDLGDAWLYAARYARDLLRALPEPVVKKEYDPFDDWQKREAEKQRKASHRGYFADRRRSLG